MTVLITAINHEARLVITEGGMVWPITTLFDIGGEPVEDMEDAVQAVAGGGDFWFCFDPHIDGIGRLTIH